MPAVDDIVQDMRRNPRDVRFADLKKVCDEMFGDCRTAGSHRVYKTPWAGDPRINIQPGKGGKAKEYQVKQVLEGLDKMEADNGSL